MRHVAMITTITVLLAACPRPRDDDHKGPEPADGGSGEADGERPSWIPVVPATEVERPEIDPGSTPEPADEVKAPTGQ